MSKYQDDNAEKKKNIIQVQSNIGRIKLTTGRISQKRHGIGRHTIR